MTGDDDSPGDGDPVDETGPAGDDAAPGDDASPDADPSPAGDGDPDDGSSGAAGSPTDDSGDSGGDDPDPDDGDSASAGGPGDDRVADLQAEVASLHDDLENLQADVDPEAVASLRADLEDLETRIDEKTVHRDDLRAELQRYVRRRQRRGHATGWGPYLVLLYGTLMTMGAFYYLGDWAAIAAMVIVWLSTLGLYVFMIVLGTTLGAGRKLFSLRDVVSKLRS
jgi:hypothetical protein